MSLRAKLLVLFVALAVGPLVAIGLLSYIQSRRALESLVATQTGIIATHAAGEIERRYAVLRSDLMLLADNAETQRLLAGQAGGADADLLAARDYLTEVWQHLAPAYYAVELRDSTGAVFLGFGDRRVVGALLGDGAREPAVLADHAILDWTTGRRLGTVVARPRLASLLPREALDARFGSAGYSVVVDRAADRILHHPRHAMAGRPAGELLADGSTLPESAADAVRPLRYRVGDSLRIATAVVIDSPPWTVLATGSADEFGAPFARARVINIALVLSVTLIVMLTFVAAVRRATRSLDALTVAADEVGRGNFSPPLPPPAADEVGRLTSAFELMTTELRDMIRQVERSRQMAAIGEFSAEIAHEIRNPLTSVKLNQQRLARLTEAGRMPAEAEEPVRISLQEAARLERIVRGVLHLGRPRSAERQPCTARALVQDALDVIGPQAERRGVRLDVALRDDDAVIPCDQEQMRGALLNLIVNALEAMPEGGTLRIDGGRADGTMVLRIADTGHGIAEADQERLFRPFFTTKPDGTGLGLAMTLRTIEEHGGLLALEDSAAGGTTFRIVLPVITGGAPA